MQREKPLFERENENFKSRIRSGKVTDSQLKEAQGDLYLLQWQAHRESRTWFIMCLLIMAPAVVASYSSDSNQLITWLLVIFSLLVFGIKHQIWQKRIDQAHLAFDARSAECGQR